jgi:N-acetylneuraminic acid mutarotase
VPTHTTPSPTPVATNQPADFDGHWQTQPPMLKARSAHAVASTGTAIYALAGTDQRGKPILDVERFDGHAWTIETTLPDQGLNAPAAVILDNRLYLIGGFGTTTNTPTDQVLVYNLVTKVWDKAAPLPNPRGGHAAAILNGKIHVVGGGNSVSTISDHSVYDPATNTWSDLAKLPRAEGSPALVAFANKLYAIGGRSGFSDFGDVYIYVPITDRWSTGSPIEPRGTAGAVVYCNTIYVFGGESQSQGKSLDNVYRLAATQDKWLEVSPLPTARNFARAVLFGDEVYVVGGSTSAGSSHASAGSNLVESFKANCQS